MNIQRILCPVDFSKSNSSANQFASMLAESSGAQIIYFHTYLPPVVHGNPAIYDSETEEKRLLKELEQDFKPTIDGVTASYAVEFGPPSDRIVEYSKENEIDLIIIGTHGRTGIRRVVMGSIAESVVRRAECPVLAIKADSQVLETAGN